MIGSRPQILQATVFHRRFRPRENRFRYRVFYLVCRLADTATLSRRFLFGVNHRALFAFYDCDHGRRDGSDSRAWIVELFAQHGVNVELQHVAVVTMPRLVGYVFNPVSFWFALTAEGNGVRAVLVEVNNTFSEHHWYLCLPAPGESVLSDQPIVAEKAFHVSPFLPREGSYRFGFGVGPEHLTITIDHFGADGELQLQTALSGRTVAFSSATLLRAFVLYPLLTLRVVALIHWQALKLWAKGATFFAQPQPIEPTITVAQQGPSTLTGGDLKHD